MKRRQISGIGFTEKAGPLLFTATGFLLAWLQHSWDYFSLLGPLFIIIGSYLSWKSFRKINPVYFDDDAFYWKEKGVEQTINYSQVVNLTAHWRGSRGGGLLLDMISLTYTTTNNLTKSISFYPVSSVTGDAEWLLLRCEDTIRIKRPEFKITGYTKELQAARVQDEARPYKLR